VSPKRKKATAIDLTRPEYYLNRELSELLYQYRVLHEALDPRDPLLERIKNLVYFTKNTDEFFMKRIGGLKQRIASGDQGPAADGRTPVEQWQQALALFRDMQAEQYRCWQTELAPALAEAGLHLLAYREVAPADQARLEQDFRTAILPMLTPLAYDPAHPFPFISNLSVSVAVRVRNGANQELTFTRIKVPPNLPAFLELAREDQVRAYVPLVDVIMAHVDLLLPGLEIADMALFRVTRSAEVQQDEDSANDLVEAMQEVLEKRRMAPAVRLEVSEDMPDDLLELLVSRLALAEEEVYRHAAPMDFSQLFFLANLDRADLRYADWTPQPHPRLRSSRSEGHTIFDEIKRGDILLHHPYHSFSLTTQRFFDEAANDPDVLAVKVVIYRTANDSQVLNALMAAAENGKQVAAIIELKARFDEHRNINWVRQFEDQGIHVAYGSLGLKTHTKTALVVRREGEHVQLYAHIGTGNYHSETAKSYVDLGLLTADGTIGRDVAKLFNILTGPRHHPQIQELLLAPNSLRQTLTGHIQRETKLAKKGKPARIVAKLNGLEDPQLTAELYRAAMAGVQIDLIVRDICRLRPGLAGLSENIRVYSIVGRFLEHSRVYYFENGGDPRWYIGSADWMTRNLDTRMEAVTPIKDRQLRRELRMILETGLLDNRRRWEMLPDGSYRQMQPDAAATAWDSQQRLMAWTRAATAEATEMEAELQQRVGRRLLIGD
jgi:polyphosphate kinase